MNESVSLGLSIVEISKIVMHKFWYDYMELKCRKKARLCYMDTDSFIVYIKTEDICVCIAKDVDTRFGTSNYELERPLSTRKN